MSWVSCNTLNAAVDELQTQIDDLPTTLPAKLADSASAMQTIAAGMATSTAAMQSLAEGFEASTAAQATLAAAIADDVVDAIVADPAQLTALVDGITADAAAVEALADGIADNDAAVESLADGIAGNTAATAALAAAIGPALASDPAVAAGVADGIAGNDAAQATLADAIADNLADSPAFAASVAEAETTTTLALDGVNYKYTNEDGVAVVIQPGQLLATDPGQSLTTKADGRLYVSVIGMLPGTATYSGSTLGNVDITIEADVTDPSLYTIRGDLDLAAQTPAAKPNMLKLSPSGFYVAAADIASAISADTSAAAALMPGVIDALIADPVKLQALANALADKIPGIFE